MNDEFKRTNPLDETHELPAPRVVHPTRARKGLQAGRKRTTVGSMVLGAIAGAAMLGPIASLAASPPPAASTQSQADADQGEVTQRATDQVKGSLGGPR
jgi:hypothetical protein